MDATPVFVPVETDECSGCEGLDEINAAGYCSFCAYELIYHPWHVTVSGTDQVAVAGPLTHEQADLRVRVHNHNQRYADRGAFWTATRTIAQEG